MSLMLITATNDEATLRQRLLASPDLRALAAGQQGEAQEQALRGVLRVARGAASAAQAFNPVMDELEARAAALPDGDGPQWLVWLHHDVGLPEGWMARVALKLQQAAARWPALAVAGAYGLSGHGPQAVRAGAVLDRGRELREATPLPCPADSLDELMVAVRVGSGLRLDAALGWDFYATDVCLQAQARGLPCAVVEAWCEHWSSTPRSGRVAASVLRRIARSAAVFEAKWAQRLPLSTPCFEIGKPGDVAAFLAAHAEPVEDEPRG